MEAPDVQRIHQNLYHEDLPLELAQAAAEIVNKWLRRMHPDLVGFTLPEPEREDKSKKGGEKQ